MALYFANCEIHECEYKAVDLCGHSLATPKSDLSKCDRETAW